MIGLLSAPAIGWLAMAALYLFAQDHLDLDILPSLAVALLGIIPGIGHVAAAYVAAHV